VKLPSTSEMKVFDDTTIKSGVSALSLMEKAGQEMYTAITRIYRAELNSDHSIIIVAGCGNNGGDGFVVARHLLQNGHDVKVVLLEGKKYSLELETNVEHFLKTAIKCNSYIQTNCFFFGKDIPKFAKSFCRISNTDFTKLFDHCSLIIDAILGTSSIGAPREAAAEAINCISSLENSVKVVSLDIPSGINSDTGEVYKPSIKAHSTLTVQLIKLGMLQSPARESCGSIEVIDIGIDTSSGSEFSLLTSNSLPFLPKRALNAHKGSFGRVIVIGGSAKFPGAPILSARASLGIGAGLVFVASGGDLRGLPDEIMPVFPEQKKGFSSELIEQVVPVLEENPVLVLGPGLGQEYGAVEFLKLFLRQVISSGTRAVIDADALNIIAKEKIIVSGDNFVFTPHPGEASRLLGISSEEVEKDRYKSAKSLSEKLGGVVILKGASSIIYSKKNGFVNSTGNPYMATPGSGDVLAGAIASLMAQGLDNLEAAKLGVFIHGIAGDKAFKKNLGPIIASDIIEFLPQSIYEFTKK